MLHYPKIPGSRNAPLERCIAFEKYDGTNLHWNWDRDLGWHSFGTRRDEFNLTEEGIAKFAVVHVHLQESVEVFRAELAEEIEEVFRTNSAYLPTQGFKVFTEFFGPHSFAGLHKADDKKELKLFDVSAESADLISPKQFVDDFGHLAIAQVVYIGKLTGKFAEDVRLGKYGVNEGVVCKGVGRSGLWMVKIKTNAYMARLKQAFADRWEDFWE